MYVLLEFWQKIMAIPIMNPLSWFMIVLPYYMISALLNSNQCSESCIVGTPLVKISLIQKYYGMDRQNSHRKSSIKHDHNTDCMLH